MKKKTIGLLLLIPAAIIIAGRFALISTVESSVNAYVDSVANAFESSLNTKVTRGSVDFYPTTNEIVVSDIKAELSGLNNNLFDITETISIGDLSVSSLDQSYFDIMNQVLNGVIPSTLGISLKDVSAKLDPSMIKKDRLPAYNHLFPDNTLRADFSIQLNNNGVENPFVSASLIIGDVGYLTVMVELLGLPGTFSAIDSQVNNIKIKQAVITYDDAGFIHAMLVSGHADKGLPVVDFNQAVTDEIGIIFKDDDTMKEVTPYEQAMKRFAMNPDKAFLTYSPETPVSLGQLLFKVQSGTIATSDYNLTLVDDGVLTH